MILQHRLLARPQLVQTTNRLHRLVARRLVDLLAAATAHLLVHLLAAAAADLLVHFLAAAAILVHLAQAEGQWLGWGQILQPRPTGLRLIQRLRWGHILQPRPTNLRLKQRLRWDRAAQNQARPRAQNQARWLSQRRSTS